MKEFETAVGALGKNVEFFWLRAFWLCGLFSLGLCMGCTTIQNINTLGEYECSDNTLFISLDNCTREENLKYGCRIRERLKMCWNYPYEAAEKGLEGIASVEFKIGRNGELLSMHIEKSSGFKELDDAVISAIKVASPFGKMPSCAADNEVSIRANFEYQGLKRK